MLTLLQIYQTLKDVLDLAINLKDLPDLINQIQGLNLKDVYLRALDKILKQQQEVLLEKGINFNYALSVFERDLERAGIDFEKLPISPKILDENIGKQIVSLILKKEFLMGVDIGIEVDSGWAERVAHATNEQYANFLFEKLFNDAVKQELQFIASQVKDNQKVQQDIKQLLDLSKTIFVQLSPDYSALDANVVRELFGISASLVELNKIKPASQERLDLYYKGERLWWDIIVAGGAVERDLWPVVCRKYSSYPERLKMLCVIGEPGAGKSTLAWHVAAEVSANLEIPIIQIKDNQSGEFWYRLEGGLEQYAKPIIILVDDIFRSADVTRALESINPESKALIISTSRINEKNEDLSLHFKIDFISIQPPTKNEINKALEKTNLQNKLTPDQIKRLGKASTWLVFMYEMTTGEDFLKHIRNSTKMLKEQDEVVYKAYEYLCFAGQYDLKFPTSLVTRLDKSGYFYNIPEYPAARGLVSYSDESHNYLSIQHSVIAKFALEVFNRNPTSLLDEILIALDPNDNLHREFFSRLMLLLLKDDKKNLVKYVMTEEYMRDLRNVNSISELSRWVKICELLDEIEHAMLLKKLAMELALSKMFSSVQEWDAARQVVESDSAFVKEFIQRTTQWLQNLSSGDFLPQTYLGFIERNGSIEQIEDTLHIVARWLQYHPQDVLIRGNYLGFVERHGSVEQIDEILDSTTQWLQEHSSDVTVRQTYLGLVERNGEVEKVEQVLQNTVKWLMAHPDDITIRQFFLGLVERKGNKRQIKEIIQETASWLRLHSADSHIRPIFLDIVGQRGDVKEIKSAVDITSKWLKENPRDINVRLNYLSLVSRRGDDADVVAEIEVTRKWIESEYYRLLNNRERAFVLEKFGMLLYRLKQYDMAEEVFSQSLMIFKGLVPARIYLAWSYYYQKAKKAKAKSELDHALWWAEVKKKHPVSHVYFHLGKYWFLEEEYDLSENYFRKAIEFREPDFNPYIYHIELGKTLLALKRTEAIDSLQTAKKLISNMSIDQGLEAELNKLIKQAL